MTKYMFFLFPSCLLKNHYYVKNVDLGLLSLMFDTIYKYSLVIILTSSHLLFTLGVNAL